MSTKRVFAVSVAVCILLLNMTPPVTAGAASEEPLYQRRNFFGMLNLKEGAPSIASGMQATKQLVGNGFVFDWVFDFEPWIAEAFKRDLIPCIRVQEGRGGAPPDPGYAGNVAWSILNYKIVYPQYANRRFTCNSGTSPTTSAIGWSRTYMQTTWSPPMARSIGQRTRLRPRIRSWGSKGTLKP